MAPSKYLRWFETSASMRPVTEGNLTDFFVTGESAFEDLADRLEFDAGKDARAYLLGWSCDINFPMRATASAAGQTLGELLTHFGRQGGSVYGMFWDNTIMSSAGCSTAVAHINALAGGTGHAILDHRTPLAGTHHQKVQVIVPAPGHVDSSPGGPPAVAYCGGMDLFRDRVGPSGLHDVHCKIRGPGADELVRVVQDRWNDHPEHTVALTERTSTADAGGGSYVQVCCTYPTFQSPLSYGLLMKYAVDPVVQALQGTSVPTAGDMRVNGSVKYYGFYPKTAGVQQVWRAVKRAIDEAKQYIYLEDQYLIDRWVGDALAAKLASVQDPQFRIVIVVLHPDLADHEQIWPRRRDVFARLQALDPRRKRWTVVHRRLDRPQPYVHSKTWIVDDELVITGSANADRRGYTYNSEADVVIAGDLPAHTDATPTTTTVAQDLRARLFAKHLGGKPTDHVAAGPSLAKFFGNLSKTSVTPFDPRAQVGQPDGYLVKIQSLPLAQAALAVLPGRPEDWLWDYLEDPDPDVPPP